METALKIKKGKKSSASPVNVLHKLVITKGYLVRATTIKLKMLLFQRCALRKFHVTDCQNARDQITSDRRSKPRDQVAFCALHSFLVIPKNGAGYIHATHAS